LLRSRVLLLCLKPACAHAITFVWAVHSLANRSQWQVADRWVSPSTSLHGLYPHVCTHMHGAGTRGWQQTMWASTISAWSAQLSS
jgi:hypothetical protein